VTKQIHPRTASSRLRPPWRHSRCVQAASNSTIKAAAALDYRVTVAADAHTTGDRPPIAADVLIAYYNDLWAQLILPDNPVRVRRSDSIIAAWQTSPEPAGVAQKR